jgi:4-hydroxybenzoate polyprenyltransferase
MAFRAWGRLLRLSLAPSAAADVAAGLTLASRGGWPTGAAPWLLIASSLCVYHGSLALNDWADRSHDAGTRPARPLPSGRISPRAASALALVLLLLGPALAALASPKAGLWMAGIAALASTYNLSRRGPLLGPLLLGTCRAGNLGVGPFTSSALEHEANLRTLAIGACLLYGIYVTSISRLGRLEDGEDGAPIGHRPQRYLGIAAVALAALPLATAQVLPTSGRIAAGAIAWTGAFGLVQLIWRRTAWTRERIEQAMGVALRRLLLFTAAVAALSFDRAHPASLIVAGLILCGYPISYWLRRVFPPS